MFKKILMWLGAAFLVLIGLFVVLIVWGHQKGAELQDKFFAAVESGNPDRVIALMNPELREQVDTPVLGAWMKAFATNLGTYKGLRMTDFHTSSESENGMTRTESVGTLDFERGSAKSELTYLDGQLVGFHVVSPQIPDDWFQGNITTDLYRRKGQEFLLDLLKGDASAAFALMHPNLQKATSIEELKKNADEVVTKAGVLKKIEYLSESFDDHKGYALSIVYHVQCESGEATGRLTFRFSGLAGSLIAYNLASVEK